jgi:hypothetical protein
VSLTKTQRLIGKSSRGNKSFVSAFRFDYPAMHPLDLAMVRQNVHASIASAKERAQHPADDPDQERAPEGASKTLDMKTTYDARHPVEHQSVHNKDE